MRQVSKGRSEQGCFALTTIIMAGAVKTVQAKEWQVAGAEGPDRGSQALAFLPNEVWIQTGDSIRWSVSQRMSVIR